MLKTKSAPPPLPHTVEVNKKCSFPLGKRAFFIFQYLALALNLYYTFLKIVIPKTSIKIHTPINIKKRTLAIPAAADSTPVKPNMPATIAIIRKMNDHFNIVLNF